MIVRQIHGFIFVFEKENEEWKTYFRVFEAAGLLTVLLSAEFEIFIR